MSHRTLAPTASVLPAEADALLIARAQQGDDRAWETLFKRYYGLVYRRARALTSSAEAAEDLAMTTWHHVWKALPHYQDRSRFAAWLLCILQRAAIDQSRSRHRRVESLLADTELRELAELLPAGTAGDPEARLLERERAEALQVALDALRRERAHYWEAVQSGFLRQLLPGRHTATSQERMYRHRGLKWLRRRLLRDFPQLFSEESAGDERPRRFRRKPPL